MVSGGHWLDRLGISETRHFLIDRVAAFLYLFCQNFLVNREAAFLYLFCQNYGEQGILATSVIAAGHAIRHSS